MWLLFSVLSAFAAVPDDVAAKMRLRDGWGGCDAVWALGSADEVRDALVAQTAVRMPPWTPMRAATCLADHADDAKIRPILMSWVADPETPGFAKLTLARLDRFPEAEAKATIETALKLDVPLIRADLRAAIATSAHPSVKALAAASRTE